jgi:type II secretory pathway component GspD/PulD (secretin)
MISIEPRRADTKNHVGDGETTDIGGIFIQTEADAQNGIPWFSKIPFLGALFRTKSTSDDRKELMIFITPRITHFERKAGAALPARVRKRIPTWGPRQDEPPQPAGEAPAESIPGDAAAQAAP